MGVRHEAGLGSPQNSQAGHQGCLHPPGPLCPIMHVRDGFFFMQVRP